MGGAVRWLASLLLALVAATAARAQEESPGAEPPAPKNTLTIGMGRTKDITSEPFTRAIGVDYYRQVKGPWEVGATIDFDMEQDLSELEGIALAAVVSYSITDRLPIFGGVGMIREHDETIAFGRLGSEYLFFIGQRKRWFIAPGAFVDYDGEAAASLMLAVGLRF